MNYILFGSLLVALLSTAFAIVILRPLAHKIGLIDVKDHRKKHTGEIPLIGGLAMFVGIAIGVILLFPLNKLVATWLLTSAGIVFLGVVDDAKDLSVRIRLVIQAIITLVLMIGTGYYLHSFGNMVGLGEVELGSLLGYVVTIIAVVGAINAFNMMDGIDGLAGLMALVSFISLAILFYIRGDSFGLYISLLFTVVITPYLANNLLLFPSMDLKHKIFLGDAGAMLIGFTTVWLLIYGTQLPNRDVSLRPITALWLIAIPLLDMIAIIIRRLRKGQSPFKADRDHIHHLLMNTGLCARKTLMLISVIAVLIASIGLLGEVYKVPDFYMLLGFGVLAFIYHKLVRVITRKAV